MGSWWEVDSKWEGKVGWNGELGGAGTGQCDPCCLSTWSTGRGESLPLLAGLLNILSRDVFNLLSQTHVQAMNQLAVFPQGLRVLC